MKLKFIGLVATCFLIIVSAVPLARASDAAGVVMENARAECKSFDNGVLETDPNETISLADLTGDGRPEEIIDGNKFSCPTALTLFCGTGGCALTVIVGEKPFEFLSKAWKVEKTADGAPLLRSAVHFSQCDYKSPCWETFQWDGSSFKSLGSKAE